MKDYKELRKMVEEQEQTLIFERFDSEMALKVGNAIIVEFPIRVNNLGGPIGTITVSGFDHEIDHGIIIDVLKNDILR